MLRDNRPFEILKTSRQQGMSTNIVFYINWVDDNLPSEERW